MPAQTPVYGLPFEVASDQPGHSLTGGSSGLQPILAEAVETELVRIDSDVLDLQSLAAQVAALETEMEFRMKRIATTVATADSANTTTTEIVAMSVTAPLVTGRIYRVTWSMVPGITVASDDVVLRIRENAGIAGNQLWGVNVRPPVVNREEPIFCVAEFTAVTTANKTFVGTVQRGLVGTGDVRMRAAALLPAYLAVDYVRGP